AAGPLPILNRRSQPASGRGARTGPKTAAVRVSRAARCRRDGALPIRRSLLRELGWTPGDALSFKAEGGRITIGPDAQGGATVRVWRDLRLRVCRTKLRLGTLDAETASVEISGRNLRIWMSAAGSDSDTQRS